MKGEEQGKEQKVELKEGQGVELKGMRRGRSLRSQTTRGGA